MAARRALDEVEVATLKVLRDAAVAGRRWRRGRVRGWVLGTEMNALAGKYGAAYCLQRLRAAGWVHSEAVRDPGRLGSPLVIWRVTQGGEDALARIEERKAAPISTPRHDPRDDQIIYISRRAWVCLAVLHRHASPVMWRVLEQETHQRFRVHLRPDDVTMVLNRGLAEREDRGSGREKVTWLAATPLGRAARLMDGRTSETLVQVRIAEDGVFTGVGP